MIVVYGITIVKDKKVISMLEECGFDVVCAKDKTVAGIITNDEEDAWVDQRLWYDRLAFFRKKHYEEILGGETYFCIREEDVIC